MPMFMDRHDLEGTDAAEVANNHLADLAIQDEHGVKYHTYWYDYERQAAFCLVDAPDAETADRVHREAHGSVANEIIPVATEAVDAFLGRVADPDDSQGPITESAFRTILFTDLVGSTSIHDRLGDEAAMAVLRLHNTIVRDALGGHHGREVKHTGDGIMASFGDASNALGAAVQMQQAFAQIEADGAALQVRIGINSGEPVAQDDQLYGLAVNLARRLCDAADPGSILVSDVVRGLTIGKAFEFDSLGEQAFKGIEAPVPVSSLRWSVGGPPSPAE
jgi:class 3 adenylate cyclase